MPRPLKRPEQPIDPYKAQPLPLGRPGAVYHRQSSEGQIGNILTTLHTIDMIEHLLDRGWLRENVHMIDADANVSGTKKIHERKGMTQFMQMIETEPKVPGYDAQTRQLAVKLYSDGMNFRRIARQLGVSYQSVINWVNAYSAQLPADPPQPQEVGVVELDELYTFIGKKSGSTS